MLAVIVIWKNSECSAFFASRT